MGDGKATWCFAKWCMVIAWKLIWCSHDEENDNWMVHDVWVTVNDNFYKIYDKRWMIAKMTHINKIMLAHPIDQSEWFKLHRLHPNVVYVNHLQWCNEGANEKCNELNIVANSWFKSKGKKNDWGKRECDEWKEILNILYLYFFCLDLFIWPSSAVFLRLLTCLTNLNLQIVMEILFLTVSVYIKICCRFIRWRSF